MKKETLLRLTKVEFHHQAIAGKQVGVNKPHTQKSGLLEKPDFSILANFRFNCAYLLKQVETYSSGTRIKAN
jgi:hypothetical protein